MCPNVDKLSLSPDIKQCSLDVWINIFEFLFEFHGLRPYCTFKETQVTYEENNPPKDGSELGIVV